MHVSILEQHYLFVDLFDVKKQLLIFISSVLPIETSILAHGDSLLDLATFDSDLLLDPLINIVSSPNELLL